MIPQDTYWNDFLLDITILFQSQIPPTFFIPCNIFNMLVLHCRNFFILNLHLFSFLIKEFGNSMP